MDQIIILVIVGAIAFGKWLIENAGKSAEDDTPEYPAQRPAPRRRIQPPPGGMADSSRRAESDEEKMRRFMEALGLPADGSAPPPPKRPATAPRNVPPPPQTPRPIVRRIEPRAPGRPAAPVPQPAPPQPARRSIAAPFETAHPPMEAHPASSRPENAPTAPSVPDEPVLTPKAAAAAAMGAAKTNVLASGSLATAAGSAVSGVSSSPFASDLREQLGDPASLRRAILLREILGEPKGLQSLDRPSIFSPL